jgi:hypothetical protein
VRVDRVLAQLVFWRLDQKSRAQPPSSGDCAQVLAQLPSKQMGAEVDYQVAARAELRTPKTPEDYADVRDGKVIWLAYGAVEYRTVFDAEDFRRETCFCYRWTPGLEESFTHYELPGGYTKQT